MPCEPIWVERNLTETDALSVAAYANKLARDRGIPLRYEAVPLSAGAELPDELIMPAKEACKLCSIDGCYEPIEGKDRCGKHVNFTGIRGETAR